ncbi:hypothetical protein HMPREF9520_03156 [Enterococcus faecalis TX1467]|nr:hypothetical protein HMPREF9520_03156 [Enterococcus faecalis TX1467]
MNHFGEFFGMTNSGVEKESQLIKAKISEQITGIKVKRKQPIKFGAIKDNAVHVFFRLNLFAVFVFEVISIIVFC